MGSCSCKTSTSIIDPEYVNRTASIKISPKTFNKERTESLLELYKIEKCLGKGSFGEVRLVTHKPTGHQRAVKIFRKETYSTRSAKQKLLNEIKILRDLDHPNIIRMFEYFEDEKKLFLIMEKCEGGELYDQILTVNSFSEMQAANLIKQLLSAIAYLHGCQIVHRDIKPENILFEEKNQLNSIKLIDFGIAMKFQEGIPIRDSVGTVFYIAPEVLEQKYTEKCDLWSCGVITYMMLCGYPPFGGDSDQVIIKKIRSGKFLFNQPIWTRLSLESQDFISKLLSPEADRLTALQALSHPWITNIECASPCKEIYHSTLLSLKNFQYSNHLKQAVRAYIISQCLAFNETKQLKEIFKSIDKNSDGKISREEIEIYYERVMGDDDNAEIESARIMENLDPEKKGFLNYSDFLNACLHDNIILCNKNLKLAFNRFDIDKSGKISGQEIKEILAEENAYDPEIWEQIVKDADKNHDGEIDFKEFADMVLKI